MTRTSAILIVLAGAGFMSFAGVTLRFLENAGSMQVLDYRSFALGSVIPVIACWRRSCSLPTFFASLDHEDIVLGMLMAAAFSTYVYSILNTTVASTLFILAAAPFIAAVVGWIWIGERPKYTTWLIMVVALAGVGLMVVDGLGKGRTLGNLMALASAFCFAVALVYVRKSGKDDMLGGAFLGGWFASLINAVLAVALGQSLVISGNDTVVSLISGAATIGIGLAFVIWGASHLPAAEVSILTLLESVVGPLWVWLVFSEEVTPTLLAGGFIVLVAVMSQAWLSRPARQPASHST